MKNTRNKNQTLGLEKKNVLSFINPEKFGWSQEWRHLYLGQVRS